MKFHLGWLHGDGKKMLYVRRGKDGPGEYYGVTERFAEAYPFDTLADCLAFWRSIHAFPQEYEKSIWNGYLHFFDETGQLHLPLKLHN